jgi:hypothetical protein
MRTYFSSQLIDISIIGYILSLNRATLHELELDAQDKFRARVLDSAAHNIKTTSRGIHFYEGIEYVDNT